MILDAWGWCTGTTQRDGMGRDILSYRYNRMLFTMITTNLTPPQIRTVYGVRIADRFNEMMLVLPYKNPSFRTPQPNAANAEKQ